MTHDITKETKDDTIELLSANLSGKELSNDAQVIINRISKETETSEISIRNTLAKLQKTKLKMVTWDYVNQATIGGLDIDIQKQNKELNKLAIESATYDLETQPAKDFIDNQLQQADLLTKTIGNSSLRQKNTLTIKQLQTNISNVEQQMGIAEASKDLNLTKLKLNVKNLEIENEMKTLMLENQPQETAMRLHGLQLDNIAQQYKNLTATEIDVATLENIKQRNIQLGQNIDKFTANDKIAYELQQKRIEKIDKELAEGPTVTMPKDAYIQKTVTDSINTAIGAPQKGTGIYGMVWDMGSMSSPFIKTLTKSATDEANTKIKTMMSEMANNPTSPLYGRDPNAIDYNNISKRILGKKLSAEYSKSITDAVETISASYIANTKFESLNDQQIDNITTMVFHLHKNEPATIKIDGKDVQLSVAKTNERLIDIYKLKTGVFTMQAQSGELIPSSKNQFNSSMLNIIHQYDSGKGFREENDIPSLPQ